MSTTSTINLKLNKPWLKWLDEMTKLSPEHILLSFLFTSGGTVGGWTLTGKLAGDEAAIKFLQIGAIAVFVMAGAQALFFWLGKKRLIYRLLFNIFFAFGIVWFMLCLILPIIWVESIGSLMKILLFAILFSLCIDNLVFAKSLFDSKWSSEGEQFIERFYDRRSNAIDWERIVAALPLPITLHVRGVPKSINNFVSVLIIVSMFVGLSLRNTFPTFSLFAWGIPSCLVISTIVQMIGLGIAQLLMLISLEKRFGVRIAPKC